MEVYSAKPQICKDNIKLIESFKSKGEGGEGGGKWVHLWWGEGMGEKAYNCN